jgi:hypothetical protein
VRIRSLNETGVSSWIYPSQQLVRHCHSERKNPYLNSREFAAACAFRFGLPIYAGRRNRCALCDENVEDLNSHAVRCMTGGLRTRCHNAIRDELVSIAKAACLQASTEVMSFPNSQRRLDLRVYGLGRGGCALATDVTLVHPFGSTAALTAVERAASTKRAEYSEPCRAANIEFLAGAVDMYAVTCQDIRTFITALARGMANSGLCDFRSAVGICFGRFNTAVVRQVGTLLSCHIVQ